MKTINLTGSDVALDLITISNELMGNLTLQGGCSLTTFTNKFGKGVIKSFIVSNEITALTFDVVFNMNVELVYSSNVKEFIDLFFCQEGYAFHKLNEEKQFEKINFRQNILVKRLKTSPNTLRFAPNETIKMSFISYAIPNQATPKAKEKLNLREMASNYFNKMNTAEDLRYLGRICFRTSKYVQQIMPISFENVSDILFKEAAILNTLASQLDRFDKDSKNKHANAPIRQYELDKIRAVSFFIQQNLTESLNLKNLTGISSLSATKLQSGFQYLYNSTVNGYITEKRLDKAAELIDQKELNISEIVYSIGFSSRSYFSKIFKTRFGMSPSTALKLAVSN